MVAPESEMALSLASRNELLPVAKTMVAWSGRWVIYTLCALLLSSSVVSESYCGGRASQRPPPLRPRGWGEPSRLDWLLRLLPDWLES